MQADYLLVTSDRMSSSSFMLTFHAVLVFHVLSLLLGVLGYVAQLPNPIVTLSLPNSTFAGSETSPITVALDG